MSQARQEGSRPAPTAEQVLDMLGTFQAAPYRTVLRRGRDMLLRHEVPLPGPIPMEERRVLAVAVAHVLVADQAMREAMGHIRAYNALPPVYKPVDPIRGFMPPTPHDLEESVVVGVANGVRASRQGNEPLARMDFSAARWALKEAGHKEELVRINYSDLQKMPWDLRVAFVTGRSELAMLMKYPGVFKFLADQEQASASE